MKVVIVILLIWGLVVFFACIALIDGQFAAWFYGVFTISQILSPLLPSVLVGQQSVASERLRRLRIHCVDLNRISICGKVRIFCFDKTVHNAECIPTLVKLGLRCIIDTLFFFDRAP